jgi:hypothetical protein
MEQSDNKCDGLHIIIKQQAVFATKQQTGNLKRGGKVEHSFVLPAR